MFRFKSCPRCYGDVYPDWDANGWHEVCIQCGYVRYEAKSMKRNAEAVRRRTRVRTDSLQN